MAAVESSRYTPFAISVVPNRDEVAVVPVGDLDMTTADEVEDAVAELTSVGFDRILIDLRQVELIDSAGLRMLLSLRHDAERRGRALALVEGGRGARRIFELTRTRGLFEWRERFAR